MMRSNGSKQDFDGKYFVVILIYLGRKLSKKEKKKKKKSKVNTKCFYVVSLFYFIFLFF
jgi:hypothetical protein